MNVVRWASAVVIVGLVVAGALGAWSLAAYRAELSAKLDLAHTGAPPAQPKSPFDANPAKSALVFAGDSRIQGWPTPPNLADIDVVNLGRSGETTAQLLARLDSDIINREPRMVVLQTGINDLKAMGVFRERAEEIVGNCWANLQAIIGTLRSHDIPVVVLTIFPIGDIHPLRRPFWSSDTLTAVGDINTRLRRLDEPGVYVFDCDPVLAVDGRMRAELAVDDFHVNSTAYDALYAKIEPFLANALARSSGVVERHR